MVSLHIEAISPDGKENTAVMAAVAVMQAPQFEQEQVLMVEQWPIVYLDPNPEEVMSTTEDSGISTDDNFPFISSEEENQNSDEIAKNESPRRKRYSYYIERGEARMVSISPSSSPDNLEYLFGPENGRMSPPLQEVELTASDEDDDGSVLELVIPLQSRYKRVPTSSPKKTKKRSFKKFLCGLLCCRRGRK